MSKGAAADDAVHRAKGDGVPTAPFRLRPCSLDLVGIGARQVPRSNLNGVSTGRAGLVERISACDSKRCPDVTAFATIKLSSHGLERATTLRPSALT